MPASMPTFRQKLTAAGTRNSSLLCVGLDPFDVDDELVSAFNRAIVDATSDLVCAYKPNLAIYEGKGVPGMHALEDTLKVIPGAVPVIGDGKRGDIENCGKAYARSLFSHYNFDAVTVNPYMGKDVIQPFLEWPERAIFVLCRTSNNDSGEVQKLQTIGLDGEQRPLYLEIARQALSWGSETNVGLVMGATFPEELDTVRKLYPAALILIPGVGPQGGSLEAAASSAVDSDGGGCIISVSRSVIFANGEPTAVTRASIPEYASAARRAAMDFRARINAARPVAVSS